MRAGAVTGLVVAAGVLCLQAAPVAAATNSSAVAPTATPTPQQAAAAVTVTADNTIHYNHLLASALPLQSERTVTIQGRQTASGCTISASGTDAAASGTSFYEEESAYNPVTCQETVVEGTLNSSGQARLQQLSSVAAPTAPAASSGAATQVTSSATANSTTSAIPSLAGAAPSATIARARRAPKAHAAATQYQTSHTKTYWIDPLDINITTLNADLKWPLHGAGGTLSAAAQSYEFPFDNWSNSGIAGPYINGVGGGWSSSAHETFRNTDFELIMTALIGPVATFAACGFSYDTAVFYHDIKTYGYSNNTVGFSWNDTKSGGCSNLVHHAANHGFGWFDS